MEPIKYTDSWGDEMELMLYKDTYESNGNLALFAVANEDGIWEEYADVTVNVEPMLPGCAALDTNNSFDLVTALVTSGDVTLLGNVQSGFCTYPVGLFADEFIKSVPTLEEFRKLAGIE